MNKEVFLEELKKINIELTEEQLKKLDQFYHFMLEWNEKINLTRITEEEDVYLKHFYDSLTLNKVVDLKNTKTLCDIGTGAGFPGIVLKIVFPNLKVTLIDSLNKRVNYLNEVIKKLKLKDIVAVHSRGEELTEEVKNKLSRKYNIIKVEEFYLPIENSKRSFIIMKNK